MRRPVAVSWHFRIPSGTYEQTWICQENQTAFSSIFTTLCQKSGASTTLTSFLGVPVSSGFSTVLVRHCLATISEDPTEQALNHITLFFTSYAKYIAEPCELWRPAHYQDFLSPLFMWNTATMLTEPGGTSQRVEREKHMLK